MGIEWEQLMKGSFKPIKLPWYETKILNCTFCGKMIAGKYWADRRFPAYKFCERECADVKANLSNVLKSAGR